MMLPLTSTLDGAESEEPLPSKMRTFWNNVALISAGGLLCGWTADASSRAMSESAAAMTYRLDTEFMQAPYAREFRSVYSKIPASAVLFNGRVASSASLPCVDFVADRGHDGGCTASARRPVTPLPPIGTHRTHPARRYGFTPQTNISSGPPSGPARPISRFHFIAPRLCCRDDLSNAISMSAASRICPTRKAVALFNRTSNALGATARGSRGTNQYDCSLGPDIDTCVSFLERQTDARRPHVSPINSACEPQGQAVDVRPARSGRVARTTGAQAHANSIRRRRPSSSE